MLKRIADLLRGKASEGAEGQPAHGGIPVQIERTGSERREFARVPVDLVVSMRFESLSEVLECRTLDISAGGVFIVTRSPRAEGTKVRLDLQVAERRLNLDGVVVRAIEAEELGHSPGMGVMFGQLTAGQKMLLEALVAKKGELSLTLRADCRSRC